MAYATVQDWLDRNGNHSFVADFNEDGEADTAAIARTLEDASAEIDGWLARRYGTPVKDPLAAPILRQHCLVIATHLMADTRYTRDDEIDARYRASVDFLKAISKGMADLPIQQASTDTGRASNVGVTFVMPERVF
ncbi:DUF1320 family protein [Pseudovibrio exalbescens]|uniref:phage protein Gp36 family protein n=1 Tax=Pseudovibrio exalbescens TaxID=197461 RepID=UPI0023657D61|nr:phage protein Gp36 family protein [Pseudovibrio exalbescens]MDD7908557.1 DUF1320 family protein [Pseudovibrio exalbescens]